MSSISDIVLCPQPFRIQPRQFGKCEQPVFADELAIELDLAAPEVGALDADHVPMDLAAVAIVGFVVGLAGRQVKAAGDLFVEKNVLHRAKYVRIKAQTPL